MNTQFRRDVEAILEVVTWNADGTAVVRCPGESLHHSAGGVPLFYPSPPRVHCFHESCRDAVQRANYELALLEGDADQLYDREPTPEEIAQQKFRKRLRKLQRLAKTRLLPTLAPVTEAEWLSRSPVPVSGVPLDEQFLLFLSIFPKSHRETFWKDDQPTILWTGFKTESGEGCELNFRTVADWEKRGSPYGPLVSLFAFRPEVLDTGQRRKSSTGLRLFMVLESDKLPIEKCGGTIRWMQQWSRLRALVLSGGKSVHAFFNVPEYPWPKLGESSVLHWQGKSWNWGELDDPRRETGLKDEEYDKAFKRMQARNAVAKWKREREIALWRNKHQELVAILTGLGCDRQMLAGSLTARLPDRLTCVKRVLI